MTKRLTTQNGISHIIDTTSCSYMLAEIILYGGGIILFILFIGFMFA